MKNSWFKKCLLTIFVFLFIFVSLFSSVSSKILSFGDAMVENKIESVANNEIESLDDYKIIFTRIWACSGEFGKLDIITSGEDFFRDVEIIVGSEGCITIQGVAIEHPDPYIFPRLRFFYEEEYTRHLIIPQCHIIYTAVGKYQFKTLSAFSLGDIKKGN